METNRTVAEREPAKLNEVSALDARRTHHRLVELLLTTAMVVMRDAPKAVRGSWADAAGGAHRRQAGPYRLCGPGIRATWTQHAARPTGGIMASR